MLDNLGADKRAEREPKVEDAVVAREDLRARAIGGAVRDIGESGALECGPSAEESFYERCEDE